MKFVNLVVVAAFLVCAFAAPAWSQELSKEDWQNQVAELTAKVNDLKNKANNLTTEVANLKNQDANKATALKTCEDELAALMGSQEAPFVALLDKIDARLDELSRLANQDLWARRAEVDSVGGWINDARKSSLAGIMRFSDRLTDQQGRHEALRRTLAQIKESGEGMQTYTVGTWARDRDCLWNIAKKPRVYGNAFLWPKIWQGNRDQIRNPDVIQPGQKLKIPAKADLTNEERSALRSYWSQKQGGGTN